MASAPSVPSRGRIAAVRSIVLVGILGFAAAFGSVVGVSCERNGGAVECRAERFVSLPLGATLPVWSRSVSGVREVVLERESRRRAATERYETYQLEDWLLLVGDDTARVPWAGALSPLRTFLAGERPAIALRAVPDARAWLVSRSLWLLAMLVIADTLVALAFGQRRIRRWLGPPPDPDAALPNTKLARLGGPVILLVGLAAVVGFFTVGHRWVGPYAGHKVEALHRAAAAGDLVALEEALARGTAVEAVDPASGRRPLHVAAQGRSAAAIARLLGAGADPNAWDLDDATPLDYAAGGDEASALALLEGGAEASGEALRRAAWAGNGRVVTALLAAGIAPSAADEHGWTPLHHAAAEDRPRVAEQLLAAGADPERRNGDGRTPYDLAWQPSSQVRELLAAVP